MANSSKSESTETEVEDAIELGVETSKTEDMSAEIEGAVEDAEIVDDGDDLGAESAEAVEEVVEVEPEPQPVAQKSGSFMPLLFGGVVAGAIGYGVATYLQPEDMTASLTATIEEQAEQIAALSARLDSLPAPDTSAVETQISEVSGAVGEVSGQLADIQTRLEQVERQPNLDGTLSETALAAYQAELDALRGELDAQQNAVMSAASQAEADLAAARAEAERLEQEALAAAKAASARAAINRIATAVDTGAPFADALGDLGDADLPAGLSAAAETGVVSNAQLVDDFPDVARAALAVARTEGLTDDTSGVGGFLRSQLNVRSSTPQEGDGPDAVLSRAEAAVKEGRVVDALAEIEALPEVVRAEITDWTAQAQERADVLDAIATLSETYQ